MGVWSSPSPSWDTASSLEVSSLDYVANPCHDLHSRTSNDCLLVFKKPHTLPRSRLCRLECRLIHCHAPSLCWTLEYYTNCFHIHSRSTASRIGLYVYLVTEAIVFRVWRLAFITRGFWNLQQQVTLPLAMHSSLAGTLALGTSCRLHIGIYFIRHGAFNASGVACKKVPLIMTNRHEWPICWLHQVLP